MAEFHFHNPFQGMEENLQYFLVGAGFVIIAFWFAYQLPTIVGFLMLAIGIIIFVIGLARADLLPHPIN